MVTEETSKRLFYVLVVISQLQGNCVALKVSNLVNFAVIKIEFLVGGTNLGEH